MANDVLVVDSAGFRAEEAESDGEKLVDGGINTGHSGETDTATSERY